jgi:tRNA pseudouridine55 synthase
MAHLLPVDALLQSLPEVTVEGVDAERFSHGNPVALPAGLTGKIRVYADGRLIGVGEPGNGGMLWPKRLVQLAD